MNKLLNYPVPKFCEDGKTRQHQTILRLVEGQSSIWECFVPPHLSSQDKNTKQVLFAKIDDSQHRYNGGNGLKSNVFEDILAYREAEKQFAETNPKVVTTVSFADGTTVDFFEADFDKRYKLAHDLIQTKYREYVVNNFPTGLHFIAVTDVDGITDYGLYNRSNLVAEIYVNEMDGDEPLHTLTLTDIHAKKFDRSLLTEKENSYFNPKCDFRLADIEAVKAALLKAFVE